MSISCLLRCSICRFTNMFSGHTTWRDTTVSLGKMSVKDRSQMKQLPDWLRRAMQLPERFRKGHGRRVPHEVEATFNEVLERMLAGFNRDLQAVTNLKMPVLVETAKSIFKKWAQAYKKLCKEQQPIVVFVGSQKRKPRNNIFHMLWFLTCLIGRLRFSKIKFCTTSPLPHYLLCDQIVNGRTKILMSITCGKRTLILGGCTDFCTIGSGHTKPPTPKVHICRINVMKWYRHGRLTGLSGQ